MTAAQTTKSKLASKTGSNATKQKAQMHRRSRTGCYTCRLRRKKCDEGIPTCSACKHLGLGCEYKRPMWWGNNEARRQHKEDIKVVIKHKKLSEKASLIMQTSVGSPPGLSHSLPTSATFSDPLDRTRSASIDSHFGFNFNSPPTSHEFPHCATTPYISGSEFIFSPYPPYEVDVKTERQMFVNDIPTLIESTTSTFSIYDTPPPGAATLPLYLSEGGQWTEHVYTGRRESLAEETLNLNFSDYAHGLSLDSKQVAIELDEGDQRLLNHFVQHVLPTIFPILEADQHGSVSSDLILPALQSNPMYLHCCLSIAGQHFKAVTGLQDEQVDEDIMRHRHSTILALCNALTKDEHPQQSLEAALGLIFFQCLVGRFDDSLPDIPWHQHFQAVTSLVTKIHLSRIVTEQPTPTPFNMTLTAWIDILGATMQGRAPLFAHTYRDKHLSPTNPSLGLRELMGCEDRVMYLISEIACLESLKTDGMDDMTLCQHVKVLGDQMNLTELNEGSPCLPFDANGTLRPKQLSQNITAAFRLAARIYLCSLVPGFRPDQEPCTELVEKLTWLLHQIPSGPNGFDRSLAWAYLVGGSVSGPGSSFRTFLDERIAHLGDLANYGSFWHASCLLREIWLQVDQQMVAGTPGSSASACEQPYIHWRDVMQMKGWDFLLI